MRRERQEIETSQSIDIGLVDDPLWFKDAIIYEVHVRAFCDANGDGIGDFSGLIEKLDYLHDLGVTAVWLLPFYPSPLRDDGYDIADYATINPAYGTMADFKRFLREAHRRGIRVITELVINHTSIDHPWFQRARRSPPGSRFRDFYVWSDNTDRYKEARIIFQDFERSNWTWDPVGGAYYWHRFYAHQPDLNFENPAVQKAVFRTLDFWMELGVDGMRLDAVPYLYERDGTNCENLPETHAFLKTLRRHIDDRWHNRMILAEANQWPEDAAEYFGAGDECHMNFHFPVMPRMFMAVQLENSFPVLDILEQTPEIPSTCQWAVFLRNHDELTLEMVTDEDRDYMYRVYAADPKARINLGIRRRLAPLLKLRRKIELMNGLLFSLPGTPVLYYGDEIGMGDNIYLGDRDGVRTPMQWSSDRNAGFSRANPQQLYLPVIIDPEHHYQTVNVEAQQENPSSLLWWMKRLIALRKQYQVFGRGDIRFLQPENHKVLAFIRSYGRERLLAVFNLSRFAQYVELDLSEFEGASPRELFGHTEFPRIGELPYLLTLGPHEFLWFMLESPVTGARELAGEEPVLLEASDKWQSLFEGAGRPAVNRVLIQYIKQRRWFRGKARRIASLHVQASLPGIAEDTLVLVIEVEYVEGGPETYILPVKLGSERGAASLEQQYWWAIIARVRLRDERGKTTMHVLHDAMVDSGFVLGLLEGFRTGGARRLAEGRLRWIAEAGTKRTLGGSTSDLVPTVVGTEQSNTSVLYGDRALFKLYRRLEPGENPDVELGRLLTRARFPHTSAALGVLEYDVGKGSAAAMGLLQTFVPNQGDAWTITLDELDRYFERAAATAHEFDAPPDAPALTDRTSPPLVISDLMGPYLPLLALLGQRTAELHLALASSSDDPAFASEPFSTLHQRALYQAARTSLRQNMQALAKTRKSLPEDVAALAQRVLDSRADLDTRLRHIVGPKIETIRIRCHGDYHLGQVLYTGKDFIIIDFEGEPARSLGERRLKRSPLRDVAGMIRSLHYAASFALRGSGRIRPDDVAVLAPWANAWTRWAAATFVGAYLDIAGAAAFIPGNPDHRNLLLDFYLLEKCIYELGYELQNRPEWVALPLRGLIDLQAGA